MALSKKKETEFYKLISDDVMDARIKIAKLLAHDYKTKGFVDNILYRLQCDTSHKAIELFKTKK